MKTDVIKEAVSKYPELVAEPFGQLLNDLGYEGLCILSKISGGTILYIPTKKRLFGKCVAECIRDEYNGKNMRSLIIKYELSERTVRNYLADLM